MMHTAQSVKNQLLADLASANTATGKADTTLHDAVTSLIEGFGQGKDPEFNIMDYCTRLPCFQYSPINNFPDPFIINAPNANVANTLFNTNAVNFKTIELNMGANPLTLSVVAGGGGYKPSGIETVRIRANGSEVIQLANSQADYLVNAPTIKTLDCVLDMSLYKRACATWIGSGMETMRFVPNTILVNNNWSASAVLTNETLISIANGLANDMGLTVTLSNESKERCNVITGTTSTITDTNTTYDFFTMEETGTVTLIEFITQVKGWTVA